MSVYFVLHLDYSNSSSTVCTVLLPLINLTLYQTLLPVTYTVDFLKLARLHIVLSLYVTIFMLQVVLDPLLKSIKIRIE